MKTLYNSLESYCAQEDVQTEIDDIVTSFARYIGKDEKKLKRELRRRRVHALSDSGNPQVSNQHYYEWVGLLVTLFDIPCGFFDFSVNEELREKLESRSTGLYDIIQLRGFSSDKTFQKIQEERYFEKSREFLKYIRDSLFIYDYLGRFDEEMGEYKLAYLKAHSDIFDEIERLLEASAVDGVPTIKYARFLALPKKEHYIDRETQLTGVKLINEIIDHCSLPLFKHIWNCLERFPEYEMKGNHREPKYGFYMLNYTPRLYHFATVNSGDYCLTEHYRYDRLERCRPDLLFIEQAKGQGERLKNVYNLSIDKMFENYGLGFQKLSREDIYEVLKFDVIQFLQKKKQNQNYSPQTLREQKAVYAWERFTPE